MVYSFRSLSHYIVTLLSHVRLCKSLSSVVSFLLYDNVEWSYILFTIFGITSFIECYTIWVWQLLIDLDFFLSLIKIINNRTYLVKERRDDVVAATFLFFPGSVIGTSQLCLNAFTMSWRNVVAVYQEYVTTTYLLALIHKIFIGKPTSRLTKEP